MKAEAVPLFKILQGGRQYAVPIYQRTYSWRKPQVQRLWDDVLQAGAENRPHFTGSVVYITTSDDDMPDVTEALLIDGQQRLTTATLFLLALVRRLRQTGGFKVERSGSTVSVSADSIQKNHLVNPEVSGRLHHKLVLTKSDRQTLAALLDQLDNQHAPLPDKPSQRVLDTLKFFTDKLADTNIDLVQVYAGLQRLQVVRVSLKEGEDDPQLIFDSMNSTGMDLSEADRIRNYVLMKFKGKEQEQLYDNHWFKMERSFDGSDEKAFDRFIRDFLSLRSKNPIPARLDEVYQAFKQYVEKEGMPGMLDVPMLVRELQQAARYYAALLDPQKHEGDPQVRRALLSLRSLDLDVWYPLVLDAYAHWKTQAMTREEFVEFLGVLETYLYRRWVCGVGTQGLNKFFPALPTQLRGQPYLQAFKDQLYQQRSYLRFPTDEDFKQQLMTRDLYARRHLSRYTLGHLENHKDKEPINPDDYTIEHILPQNKALGPEWRQMLGDHWAEIQGQYLHTLGNLTLTGYNSEYSDRPFSEKRDMLKGNAKGFKTSHLLLNQEVAEATEWNESRIRERAERLADRALEVWPMVEPSNELLEQLKRRVVTPGIHTLEDHLGGLPPALRVMVDDLRQDLLGLHPEVEEVPTKKYIAFKVGTNFCDITPQPDYGSVKCWLNISFNDLEDPLGLARDVTEIGHHGNGDVEVTVRPETPREAFLDLVQQALNYQLARQQASPESGSGAAQPVDFTRVPAEGREVLQALTERTVALGATTHETQSYRAFRDHLAFMEVRPRTDGVNVALKLAASMLGEGAPTWFKTGGWVNKNLTSLADLESVWPAIQLAFERQKPDAANTQPSPGITSEQYKAAKALFKALLQVGPDIAPDVEVSPTQKSVKYFVAGKEFARVYSSLHNGVVGLRLNILPGQLMDANNSVTPTTPEHQQAGYVPGHAVTSGNSSDVLNSWKDLLKQTYEENLASVEEQEDMSEDDGQAASVRNLMSDLVRFITSLDSHVQAEERRSRVYLTRAGRDLGSMQRYVTKGYVSITKRGGAETIVHTTDDRAVGEEVLRSMLKQDDTGA